MQNQPPFQNFQNQPSMQNQQIMQTQPIYMNHQDFQNQPQMQSQPIISNQSKEVHLTFPVIYKKCRFMVDPILLCNTSRKFRELYQPLENGNYKFGPMQLEIACTNFSERNVDNFLKICQNLPNDVQDSETKEICEIARLFQADQIYNSGLSFVQQAIDPQFYVPDNKYEESNGLKYLYIEPEGNSNNSTENMNELEFNLLNSQNEGEQQPMNGGYININTVPSTNNTSLNQMRDINNNCQSNNNMSSNNNFSNTNASSNNFNNTNSVNYSNNSSSNNITSNDHKFGIPNNTSFGQFYNQNYSGHSSSPNLNENGNNTVSNRSIDVNQKDESNTNNENQSDNANDQQKPIHSVVYQIKIDIPLWKCNRFFFIQNGQIVLTAKQKNEYIVIGSGADVHISTDTSNHVGNIIQNEDYYNDVSVEDQKFIVKYVSVGKAGHYSIELSFKHNGNTYYWGPRDSYNKMENYGYNLKLNGEYNHHPIRSRKNTVLQNPDGQTTFIVRKMDENFFEAECHPDVPPTIAFAIALSDIVGPYYEFDGQFNF